MVSEADKLDLTTPDALRAIAAATPYRPGAAKVRKALDRHTFVLTDSHLDLGLVVETDGLRYHRTPSQQSKDLRRDQDHAAAGQERLRFSHWQVTFEAGRVVEVLEAVAARLLTERRHPA
jgi:very-short-patch-repair endonuclease